jgi:predicted PurR-regulated permease PerM
MKPLDHAGSGAPVPEHLLPTPLALAAVGGFWLLVLSLHLTPAFFAALITYSGSCALAAWARRWLPNARRVQLASVLLMLSITGLGIALLIETAAEAAASGGGYASLLTPMAAALEQLRHLLPAWIAAHLPVSIDAARSAAAIWLREHATELQLWGGHTLRGIGYGIAGAIIGALMALQLPSQVAPTDVHRHWPRAIRHGFDALVRAFSTVVFAQLRIASINTVLTGVFLLGIVPMIGAPLPLTGTLLAMTFVASLLPIVGNLVSNTVIVLVALSQSVLLAGLSLGWLVAIHKLEYVVNAQIIGTRIQAKPWELLIAMLLMESMFGLAGLVSAPVIYAQATYLLRARNVL